MVKLLRVSLKGCEITNLTTVDDSGAHTEDNKLLDVCDAPDTAAPTFLAKCMSWQMPCAYQGQLLNSMGKVCSNMTSIGDVIIMSHRTLLASARETAEHRYPWQ